MTWYYADWNWVQTLTTTAAMVMVCGVVVCATINLIRTHLSDRHAGVLVMRHAPHHHNGSRAA